MQWLIDQQAFAELKAYNDYVKSGGNPQDVSAFFFLMPQSDKKILTIEGKKATIDIEGVLRNTKSPYFGTGYPDILEAIAKAEEDKDVESVDFVINSPGGMVSGLFGVTDAISAMKKPKKAIVSEMAASAAYAIAAQADKIIATSRAATFGSIGIVQTFYVYESEVSITSTDAPNKAPNPTTEEGKASIQGHLDQYHALFADAIATGRSNSGRATSANDVNSDFGRGGVFLAAEAVRRGMADELIESTALVLNHKSATLNNKSSAKLGENKNEEVKKMDLALLKADHSEVYRQAVAEGVAKERDRVSAHMTYGEKMGAMDIAVAAVKDGSEITEALRAEYMTAGMNKKSLDAMKDDNSYAPNGQQKPKGMEEADFEAAVFAELTTKLGVEGDE